LWRRSRPKVTQVLGNEVVTAYYDDGRVKYAQQKNKLVADEVGKLQFGAAGGRRAYRTSRTGQGISSTMSCFSRAIRSRRAVLAR